MKPLSKIAGRDLFYARPTDQTIDNRLTFFLSGIIADGTPDPETGMLTVNSDLFAQEMFFAKDQGFDLTIRINSPGGEVFAGMSILDAVHATRPNTLVAGLAASMAAVIFENGERRYMNDFAAIMIHSASNGSKELLDMVNNQLAVVLQRRSKLTKKDLENIMKSGKDVFFNVTPETPADRNALTMGLVDEVIETRQKFPVDLENYSNPLKLVARYNSILLKSDPKDQKKNKKRNSGRMDEQYNILKSKMGLGGDATETQMVAKYQEVLDKANKPQTDSEEVTKLKNQVATLQAARIEDLKKSAKLAGFPEDQLEKLENLAKTSFEGAEDMVNIFASVKGAAPAEPSEEGAPAATAPGLKSVADTVQIPGTRQPKKLKPYDWYMDERFPKREAMFYKLNEKDQFDILDGKYDDQEELEEVA